MNENEFWAALIKAFNAGRAFTKSIEIPEDSQNVINEAYPSDVEILMNLDSNRIITFN